jgi:MGT family glycosyltransferase
MAKHIAFFNFPAFGHINPTLGVVQELVRRGHRVTSTTTDHFAPAIEAVGGEPVRYTSVFGQYYTNPYTEDAVKGEGMRSLNEGITLMEQVEPFYAENPPDLVVHDFMSWGARFYTSRHDIPRVRLFPSYGANEVFSINEKFPITEFSDPQVMDMFAKLEKLLPEVGMAGMGAMDFFTHIEKLGIIFLTRGFHYDGDTFDDRFVFAGPCLGDRSGFQGSWKPSRPDRKLVFVSLGTAATGWKEFFPMCVEAFGNTEWDVVIATGDHLDPAELGELPENVEASRHVPQLDVLSHADLFVTHGGMNSVMESLYHGVPMVVLPQMSEQRANALRVEELGLGTFLARDKATVDSLRNAAKAVDGDPSVGERVRAAQREMRELDGSKIAADAIEGFLAKLD